MDITKKNIKDWIKSSGKNRKWLADQCLVTIATVNDWFTSRGTIPDTKLALIKTLMEKPLPSSEKKELITLPDTGVLDRITVEVEGDLQIRISKKAQELGMTISCWASLALEEAAEEPDIMERIERRYAKKNPTGAKSAGNDGAHGNIPKPGLSTDRRYLRAARLDGSETA